MSNQKKEHRVIRECIKELKAGNLPPWKLENELLSKYGVNEPENFRTAAICRQRFIEEKTGEKFKYITISEKPFKINYLCRKDKFIWTLDARDSFLKCSLCGSKVESLGQYGPLVENYIGGSENYYSYAGRIKVKGDIEKEFTNLLVYGTGLGPIGVARGCFKINKLGGAIVRVAEYGRAARCNGYIFRSEKWRSQAIDLIKSILPQIKVEMNKKMAEFSGTASTVEFKRVESQGDFILYVDFTAGFKNFRGHGDISKAVGYAKNEIEIRLRKAGIEYELSVIAQGYDGDLKPSPQNKRGRYASAEIRVPGKEFKRLLKVDPQKFISFVKIDRIGAQELGCQFYSGMGGEIIPAIYRAVQVNPRSPLVSSFQNIYIETENNDVVYRVELPNIEVGIASSREGLIPPGGREALRIMGVNTAREFAAAVAAQVLAGEFNLALEISRGKLYSS
jgi:hydroxymethylglutaryl-CoA reductase